MRMQNRRSVTQRTQAYQVLIFHTWPTPPGPPAGGGGLAGRIIQITRAEGAANAPPTITRVVPIVTEATAVANRPAFAGERFPATEQARSTP